MKTHHKRVVSTVGYNRIQSMPHEKNSPQRHDNSYEYPVKGATEGMNAFHNGSPPCELQFFCEKIMERIETKIAKATLLQLLGFTTVLWHNQQWSRRRNTA